MEIPKLETLLLAIAAIVIAVNQALKDATKVRASLPSWVLSKNWNYVPAIFLILATIVFIYREASPSQMAATHDARAPQAATILDLKQRLANSVQKSTYDAVVKERNSLRDQNDRIVKTQKDTGLGGGGKLRRTPGSKV